MTRHLIDHPRNDHGETRLPRYLALARQAGRHPAITALLRRSRDRNPPQGQVAVWTTARQSERDQARTSFS